MIPRKEYIREGKKSIVTRELVLKYHDDDLDLWDNFQIWCTTIDPIRIGDQYGYPSGEYEAFVSNGCF